jgi:predicted adenylyl cyclase CyaB
MGVEVELKAWISDPEVIRERLRHLGTNGRSFVKEDRYFGTGDAPEGARYRIRRDGEAWICTVKDKRIVAGIEENREIEFTVSDGDAFEAMLTTLGLRCLISKRKEGQSFFVDGLLVEVSHVRLLGWFVEVEVILPDDAGRDAIESARHRLLDMLKRLDVPPSAIESRSYNQMIYEATTGTGTVPGTSL